MNKNRYSIKNFYPLITIFLVIILITLLKFYLAKSWNLHSLMNDFMGIFFIIFGLFKIFNLKNFAEAYSTYDLIAKQTKLYAYVYPFIELFLGIFYLLHLYPIFTNFLTLIVMFISAAGVAVELFKGAHITCACLGVVFKIPMTYVTLLEDLLMAFMALLMLLRK